MLLLNPIWLLLGLAAIPILLLQAQRPRRQVVPSLKLWRALETTSATTRRLAWPRLTPSLLLQLAALAAITLAAANLRIVPATLPDHTVLVIDSSAAMSDHGAFETALHDAGDIVSALDKAGTGVVSIISVEGEARLLAARREDAATALRDIDRLTASDQRADWAGAALWLKTIVNADERTQVHILSSHGGRLLDHYAPHDLVSISATPYALSDQAIALRVDALTFEPETQSWAVRGQVRAGGAMPEAVSLSYARAGDDNFLDWGEAALAEPETVDGVTTARFAARLSLPGDGRLIVDAVPGSGNAAHRHHAVIDTAPAEILIVGDPVPELVRALEASVDADISQADSLPDDTQAYDLVVLNGPKPQDPPQTNVLYLGASAIDLNQQPGGTATGILSGWNGSHPLSDDVDWAGLETLTYVEGALPPGLAMVAQMAGRPILATRTTGSGRDVYFSAQLPGEAITQDPAFPLLISNIVDWMRLSPPLACTAGVACPLDRHQRSAEIVAPNGEIVYDGARLAASGAVLDAPFRPRDAGFHMAGNSVIAVNSAGYALDEAGADRLESWQPSATYDLRPWLIALAMALLAAELALYLAARRLPGRDAADLITRHRLPIFSRGLTVLTLGAALAPLAAPVLAPLATRVIVADETSTPSGAGVDAISITPNAPFIPDGPPLSWSRATQLAIALAPLPPRLAVGGDIADDGRLAERILADGAPVIDLLPQAPAAGSDISIASINAPQTVAMGETYSVTGLVHSDGPGEARLITLRNGLPVDSRQLDLVPGLTRADIVLTPGSDDAEFIEMVVEAASDRQLGNNIDAVLVQVVPSPSTLVVARDADQGAAFQTILANQGLEVEVAAPNAAPRSIEDWLTYEAIVLLDTGARDLRFDQLDQVRAAVGTFGKGLLIAGDANAFGAGGYYGTPLEALSPLSSRVPHDRPQTAIMFVMDRSGSMEAPVGPVMRLDIAKAALANAADLMEPDDLFGIIGFDDAPQTIVPLRERGEEPIAALLANVVPGGGTALMGALDEAIGVLEAADASVAHIVVITDGLVEPVDFSALLDRAQAAEITISTVAAGSSAVTDRLERIAEDGGGMYYATRDFQTLPAILMQDIMTLDESVVIDEPTAVAIADDGRRLGLNLADLPPLDRHVRTTAKPDARVMLTLADMENDSQPLAATWRYGVGTVTAFAMNPTSETASPWAGLEGFARLWSQSVRDVLPDMVGPGIDLRANRMGDGFDIRAEITGVEGQSVPVERLEISIAETGAVVDMTEIAPGRSLGRIYQAPIGPMTMLASVGDIEAQATAVQAYPSHLRPRFDDPRGPERLALASGGAVLARNAALPPIESHWVWRPLSQPWLVIALALFLFELLAVRRGWWRS